jgi:hypothetical protein
MSCRVKFQVDLTYDALKNQGGHEVTPLQIIVLLFLFKAIKTHFRYFASHSSCTS